MPRYLKVFKWLFVIWAFATFILYPVVPLYGRLRPWPEAEAALRKHGLEDSLREILAAIQARKQDGQKQARLALLEHLLEGQPPLTEAELAVVRDE